MSQLTKARFEIAVSMIKDNPNLFDDLKENINNLQLRLLISMLNKDPKLEQWLKLYLKR